MASRTLIKKLITFLLTILIFFHICRMFYRRNNFKLNESYSSTTVNEIRVNKIGNGIPVVEQKEDDFIENRIKDFIAKDEKSGKQKTLATGTIHTSTTPLYNETDQLNKKEIIVDKHYEVKKEKTKAKLIEEAILKWNVYENQEESAVQKETAYHGHDLMKDPPIKFSQKFKNPCWYERNDGRAGEGEILRCLPYVFVIGVKKCGTSDLFYRLTLHPEFIKPGFKEAQWFARKRFKNGNMDDFNNYIDMFSKAALTIDASARNASKRDPYNYRQITGEGSPSNLHLNTHWMYLPGNENVEEPKFIILDYIHHFLPNAKLLITFRDPVERLYSDYYHEYGSLQSQNSPNPRQFHLVVTEGIKLYQDCFQHHSVRSCVFNPKLNGKTRVQIQLGIYCVFWEELTRLFPREQILVLQNKNLRDKENTMRSVYNFLEMRTLSDAEMYKVINSKETYQRRASFKDQGPMFNETFNMLYQFYKPFNQKMAALTGSPDFLYAHDFKS